MKRINQILCAVLLAVVLVTVPQSCATGSAAIPTLQQIVNADQASRAYVAISDVHTAVMESIVTLRAAGKISDAQWSHVAALNEQFKAADNHAIGALVAWRSGGPRAGFDAAYAELMGALSVLQGIR